VNRTENDPELAKPLNRETEDTPGRHNPKLPTTPEPSKDSLYINREFTLGLALGFALGLALGFALGLALGFALGLALGFVLGMALG